MVRAGRGPTQEAARSVPAGRPREAAGNGGPRWMITAATLATVLRDRIRLTGRLIRFTPSDLRKCIEEDRRIPTGSAKGPAGNRCIGPDESRVFAGGVLSKLNRYSACTARWLQA